MHVVLVFLLHPFLSITMSGIIPTDKKQLRACMLCSLIKARTAATVAAHFQQELTIQSPPFSSTDSLIAPSSLFLCL